LHTSKESRVIEHVNSVTIGCRRRELLYNPTQFQTSHAIRATVLFRVLHNFIIHVYLLVTTMSKHNLHRFNPLCIFLIEFLNEEENYRKILITKIQGRRKGAIGRVVQI
jgi:hypothetical protein